MTRIRQLACACGQVRLEAYGAAIISTECHCDSCRAAAARVQGLPGAPPFQESNGGTRTVLYRKDRIHFVSGGEVLKTLRLTPAARTRRVVATCCNTPVFMEFANGHWLDLYGCLWPEGKLPPLDLRTMTGDLADASYLPDDVPNARRQSVLFFAKLMGAWIAMGFRSPKITLAEGSIHA
ncbi:MAG: hypothetical protein EON94_14450 [Caulobacteraceae bacterium]|nr:MAG: hypothetical protein EON94_14450 [Caulobacteraceae bacterium]